MAFRQVAKLFLPKQVRAGLTVYGNSVFFEIRTIMGGNCEKKMEMQLVVVSCVTVGIDFFNFPRPL